MIVSIASNKKLGMSITYGFLLYAVVLQSFSSGGFILMFIYQQSRSFWILFLKMLFYTYPSFHYSKIFADVEKKADRHFDGLMMRWVDGTSFTMQDLTSRTQASIMIGNIKADIPSPL